LRFDQSLERNKDALAVAKGEVVVVLHRQLVDVVVVVGKVDIEGEIVR